MSRHHSLKNMWCNTHTPDHEAAFMCLVHMFRVRGWSPKPLLCCYCDSGPWLYQDSTREKQGETAVLAGSNYGLFSHATLCGPPLRLQREAGGDVPGVGYICKHACLVHACLVRAFVLSKCMVQHVIDLWRKIPLATMPYFCGIS